MCARGVDRVYGSGMSATATEATSPIATRVAELRELATTDAPAAQEATWAWFRELGKRRDTESLGELYQQGDPPRGLDGATQGILVVPLIQGVVDRAAATLTRAWMPWLGKSFDAAANRGYNRLAPSARWPAKLLWPAYSTSDDEDARHAFDFETAIEPGKADPEVQVLKIDYGPVATNPRLVIRRIRDELVQIVPDTYLGKILWRSGDGDDATYACIGYFALRQPATG
jgi:hypothetical protein